MLPDHVTHSQGDAEAGEDISAGRRVSSPTRAASHRLPALDGVRALAIVAVIAFHAGVAPGGGLGVTMFFVLSGYLITGLLLRPHALTGRGLRRFYLRRFLRLFPALAAVCLFALVWAELVLSGSDRGFLLTEILTSLTYTQDFYLGHGSGTPDFGYLGQTWSLAVEEQFYIFWPVLLLGIGRVAKSRGARIAVIAAAAGVVVAWRAHLAARGLNAHVGLNIDAQADSLLVGCVLALAMPVLAPALARRPRTLDAMSLAGLTWIVLDAALGLTGRSPARLGYLATSVSTACLLCRLLIPARVGVGRALACAFSWPPVVFVGSISYGLYLWHPTLFALSRRDLGVVTLPEKVAAAPVLAVAIFGAAYLSWRFIEQPVQRFKDRRLPAGGGLGPGDSAVPVARGTGRRATGS